MGRQPAMRVLAVVMVLCTVSACLAAPTANTWKWEVTVDVFEGSIEGFFSEFQSFKTCANDTVEAYDQIRTAVTLLEKKTPESVLKGIKDLGVAFGALKDGLVECKAVKAELDSFVNALEQFKTPSSFAFHVGKDLLVNGKDIYAEITQAISLWKAQRYQDAGIRIGEALNKLIVGDKWRAYALNPTSFNEAPTPKSKCALKCTAEALAVYWGCAGACIAKQAANSCILDACPAVVTAFDVPCLKKCPQNTTIEDEAAPLLSDAPLVSIYKFDYPETDSCGEEVNVKASNLNPHYFFPMHFGGFKVGHCADEGYPIYKRNETVEMHPVPWVHHNLTFQIWGNQ